MPVIHVKGNLMHANSLVIAHGCNCFNTMGSGVAKALAEAWPAVAAADKHTTKGDESKLGTYSLALVPSVNKIVFNLYTQYRYGREKQHLDYAALNSSLVSMRTQLNKWDRPMTVAMPRIGCGLAGGNWPAVERIINEVFPNRTIYIYTL